MLKKLLGMALCLLVLGCVESEGLKEGGSEASTTSSVVAVENQAAPTEQKAPVVTDQNMTETESVKSKPAVLDKADELADSW